MNHEYVESRNKSISSNVHVRGISQKMKKFICMKNFHTKLLSARLSNRHLTTNSIYLEISSSGITSLHPLVILHTDDEMYF